MSRLAIAAAVIACLFCLTPAQAQPNLVTWTDPLERAFSCQVPQGWEVEGGMRRISPLDVRPEVLVSSPDGRVLCRMGDVFIQPMVQPNAFMQQLGFGEGRLYSPGYGHVSLVLRYLPGARYLTDYYLPNRVGQVSNLRAGQMPAVGQMSTQALAQVGIYMQEDAGGGDLRHPDRGRPQEGLGLLPDPGGDRGRGPGAGHLGSALLLRLPGRPGRPSPWPGGCWGPWWAACAMTRTGWPGRSSWPAGWARSSTTRTPRHSRSSRA